MNNTIHSPVKDLPDILQRILKSLKYHKRDIVIRFKDKESVFGAGGDGRREFSVLVNLSTDQYETKYGSWGGANIFNRTNQVDLDQNEYALMPNLCVIKGSEGGYGTMASITFHPDNAIKMLPPKPELTGKQQTILYAYDSIKPGQYRKDELARCKATDQDIEEMIKLGLLKKDGRGIQITTMGKNARNK
jgi:hypothetical protein